MFAMVCPAILAALLCVLLQVTTTTARCSSNQFTCTVTGDCIPIAWRCDGESDCLYGSDEQTCPPPCSQTEFDCGDGTCLYEHRRCDGVVQCPSGSDEDDCCTSSQFECGSHECVDESNVCDGYYNCYDGSDENNCPSYCYHFECDDGQCLTGDYECDGYRDCSDGSDEDDCGSSNTPSSYCYHFECDDGQCLTGDYECDGYRDCSDGSDEDDCGSRTTPSSYCYHFECDDGQCLTGDYECDGYRDCSDGSDEDDCGSSSTSSSDVALVFALTAPLLLMTIIPLLCVVVACYCQAAKRRRAVPVIRTVAQPRINNEVILVTCQERSAAMETSGFPGDSSLESGPWLEPPPAYSASPDPTELSVVDPSPPPQYSFENPLTMTYELPPTSDSTHQQLAEVVDPSNHLSESPDEETPTLIIRDDRQPLLGQ